MYNEELKKKFIQVRTKSVDSAAEAVRTFNRIEPFEKEWGADVCTQGTEELQRVFGDSKLTGSRSGTSAKIMLLLRAYSSWCIANGVPGAKNNIVNVKVSGIEQIKKDMVSSPMHLQRWLDDIFDPESLRTMDNAYRCYDWLAFMGIWREDIGNITVKDVDFMNMCVHVDGEEFPIYRESLPVFRNLVTLSSFRYIHPLYSERNTMRDRIPGDKLLRGVKADYRSGAYPLVHRQKVAAATERTKADITVKRYDSIKMSGYFYRMNERERSGYPVNFKPLAAYYEDRSRIERSEKARKQFLIVTASTFGREYARWKLAFSV